MKNLLYLIFSLFLLSSCEQESLVEVEEQTFNPDPEYNLLAGPVVDVEFNGAKLKVKSADRYYLFEGDILIPKNYRGKEKAAAIMSSRWWDSNTIAYEIDPNLPKAYRVHDAIAHWESKTNLTFVERTTERDYLSFVTSNGCSSYIGKIGGKQPVFLGSGCSTGTTIHEIGHAVGLWHEQARADRDQFVNILYENIPDAYEYNFNKYTDTWYGGIDLTSDMDFNSIMLYSSYAFSTNGLPTIVKKDGSTYWAQRSGLSSGDIYGLNVMYPADPEKPEFENGQIYTVDGLRLLRNNDKWYYKVSWGAWLEVKKSSYGYWYYV